MGDPNAFAMAKTDNRFLDDCSVVPLPRKGGARKGSGHNPSVLNWLHHLRSKLARDNNKRARQAQTMERTIKNECAETLPSHQSRHDYQYQWYLFHHLIVNP